MKILQLLLGLCVSGIILFFILVVRPVPIPAEKDCLIARGIVQGIEEGGVHDVVFKLKGSQKTFYVNRGLERGMKMDVLKKTLVGQEIVIKYPSYWTPLGNSMKHVSKIESQGQVIFSELKE